MWTKGLLLGVVLLGLIADGRSQSTSPPTIPEPLIDPVPVESCRSPETRTETPGPKCNYYMVVPFRLTSGSEGIVCTWLKSEVPVTVTVNLEIYLTKVTIVYKEATSEYFECTHFTVPTVDKQEAIYFNYTAVGVNVTVVERKPAVIDIWHTACMAQKIKPLFKQGETVQLRLICLNERLKQVVKNFTKVTVVDPTGIRVSQDLNPTIENGVVIFSFATSPFSRLGFWNIQFEDDKGEIQYASFQLQEYYLPRFNWNTNCPNTISVLDKTAIISGSAQYVYGKSVPGTAVVRCCRRIPKYGRAANCFQGVDDICMEFTKQLDENGNFTEHLNMDVFKLPFSGYENSVTCDMTMKENGTGILVPSSCYMLITNKLAILQLDRTTIGPYYNKVNIPFAVTLTDEKNNPMAFKSIIVQIDGADVKYVTTDANGRAECVIETSSYYQSNITLSATYSPPDLCYGDDSFGNYYPYSARSYPYDAVTLFRYYSHSNSQIRIRRLPGELPCHQNHLVQVDYSLTKDGVGENATTANFKYIILSRNTIATHGDISVDLSQGLQGSTYIQFYADHKVATGAKVLVFVVMEKDIITDTVDLNTGLCFENEVNMTFTEQIVAPGALVHRKITAYRGSFCGLRAKDVSFNLISPYDDFNAYSIYSSVQFYLFGYQYGGVNYKDPEPPCIDGNKVLFCNGMYTKPTSGRTDRDSNQDFEGLSLLFFSNLGTRRPKVCGEETEPTYPIYYAFDGAPVAFSAKAAVAGGAPGVSSIDTVRDDFREVFGYDTVIIGSEGESIVSSIIPQTITKWQSDTFCMSPEKGIGLTTVPATVTTMQPFFVETSFPSKVIRGEVVDISIIVANYLNSYTQIKVEVGSSEDYEITFLDDVGEQCAGSKQRVSWPVAIKFLKMGPVNISIKAATTKISDTCNGTNDDTQPSRSDTIILRIDVVAEGIKREASSTHLIVVKDGTAVVEISVSEPDDLVTDSFKCIVNIMGDLVALSVENFDKLLSTPSGCCDQIQAEVLAAIFLERYLKTFGELSEDRSKKMLAKFSSGYMNLLSCRQYDGGYSRYISSYISDPWGTVLDLRTNHFLADYIYIDDSVQTQGLISVSRYQDLESGCLNPGTDWTIYQEHYNSSIQLTALAAPILLELSNKNSNAGPLLEGVNKCLNNVDFEGQNTLTQCYLLNAAASRGDWDTWQSYYIILQGKAIYNGDTLYWVSDNSVMPVVYRYFPGSLGDVLSTATVLISLTKHPNPDQDLINQMASIAKWLSGQLTGRGGFYSSQATTAGIEALTFFGRLINTSEPNAQVSIQRDGAEVFNVTINKSNKFIVQSKEISPCFGDYKFTVTGTGNPLVQFTTYYNTKIATGADSDYILSAQASAPDCFGGVARLINIKISFSFNGASGGFGTTLLIVYFLTGYEFNYSSRRELPGVNVYSVEESRVLLYTDTVNSDTIEFTIPIYLRNTVTTFQTAYVVAEDINTGATGAAQYQYPCDNKSTVQ